MAKISFESDCLFIGHVLGLVLWDHPWVKKCFELIFFKGVPRPFVMLGQVVLAQSEPVVTHFGPHQKIPKGLPQIGHFGTSRRPRRGQKCIFSGVIQCPLGCAKLCPYPNSW